MSNSNNGHDDASTDSRASFQRVDSVDEDYRSPPHSNAAIRWNKTRGEMYNDGIGYVKESPERGVELIVCLIIFISAHFLPQWWSDSSSAWESPIPFQETQAGDVMLELDLSYDVQSETVPVWMLIIIGIVLPIVLLLGVGTCYGPPGDAHASLCVYFLSVGMNSIFTNLLKVYCGRLRPNFYSMCQFDATDSKECKANIPNAHWSFPSGHSSLSFCSMTILSLYFLGKIGLHHTPRKRRKRTNGSLQKLLAWLAFMLPMSIAFFVASSRVHDFFHHPVDVLAGAAIGVVCARFGTSLWYPSVDSEMTGYPWQYVIEMDRQEELAASILASHEHNAIT